MRREPGPGLRGRVGRAGGVENTHGDGAGLHDLREVEREPGLGHGRRFNAGVADAEGDEDGAFAGDGEGLRGPGQLGNRFGERRAGGVFQNREDLGAEREGERRDGEAGWRGGRGLVSWAADDGAPVRRGSG